MIRHETKINCLGGKPARLWMYTHRNATIDREHRMSNKGQREQSNKTSDIRQARQAETEQRISKVMCLIQLCEAGAVSST